MKVVGLFNILIFTRDGFLSYFQNRTKYLYFQARSIVFEREKGGGAQIHPKNLNTQKRINLQIIKMGAGGGRALCYVPDFDFDVFLIINHFRKTKIC